MQEDQMELMPKLYPGGAVVIFRTLTGELRVQKWNESGAPEIEAVYENIKRIDFEARAHEALRIHREKRKEKQRKQLEELQNRQQEVPPEGKPDGDPEGGQPSGEGDA
jgi:hypothetical protein